MVPKFLNSKNVKVLKLLQNFKIRKCLSFFVSLPTFHRLISKIFNNFLDGSSSCCGHRPLVFSKRTISGIMRFVKNMFKNVPMFLIYSDVFLVLFLNP